MGILDWFSKDGIAKPIEAVGDLYTTDKARIEAETNYQAIVQKPALAQLANNAIMASAHNFFSNGWQAMIGWTSGFLVLIYYAPQIILTTYMWYNQCIDMNKLIPFPMKPDDILNLVWLLFGFGGMGIIKNRIGQ